MYTWKTLKPYNPIQTGEGGGGGWGFEALQNLKVQ